MLPVLVWKIQLKEHGQPNNGQHRNWGKLIWKMFYLVDIIIIIIHYKYATNYFDNLQYIYT